MNRKIKTVAWLMVMGLMLASCSPYRVRKKAPSAKHKGPLSILEFRKSGCGCN